MYDIRYATSQFRTAMPFFSFSVTSPIVRNRQSHLAAYLFTCTSAQIPCTVPTRQGIDSSGSRGLLASSCGAVKLSRAFCPTCATEVRGPWDGDTSTHWLSLRFDWSGAAQWSWAKRCREGWTGVWFFVSNSNLTDIPSQSAVQYHCSDKEIEWYVIKLM